MHRLVRSLRAPKVTSIRCLAGSPQGFLATADLIPLTTTELQVELEP